MKVIIPQFPLNLYGAPAHPRVRRRYLLIALMTLIIISSAITAVRSVKNELSSRDQAMASVQSQVHQRDAQISQLERQLDEANLNSTALNQEMGSKDAQIADYQAQLANAGIQTAPALGPSQTANTASQQQILDLLKKLQAATKPHR